MTSKIKDLVEVVSLSTRAEARPRGVPESLATFLMSYEIGDVVVRSLERLAGPEDGPHNCLVVGGAGCGKSRMLDAIAALLETPDFGALHSRLAEARASIESRFSLVVRVAAPDGERRLAIALEGEAFDRLQAEGFPCPALDVEGGSRLDGLAKAVAALPSNHRLIFIIDNLDRWLDTSARYAIENAHTLVRLGDLSRTLPVAVCAAAGEYVLSHDSAAGEQGWIAALLDTYRIEYVPARALRSATASNVLVKNARQRKEISEVLEVLRGKLPELACGDEEFVELYPLEGSTWTVGGHLHRWLDGFSFPEFATRAAESVKRRPAPSLFALNDMFTLYEPQLRHVSPLLASFSAYDHLVAEALPKLGQQQRLWGRLALQSIFMHTLAGIAADVKTITNSVLLYDLHGGGSSYAMMSAVLKQLETLDRGQLVATGEGATRRYSLVTGEREALLVLVDETAESVDEEDVTLAMLGAGGHVFADWPFAAPGPDRARRDLWEIEQGAGQITIVGRSLEGRDTGDLAEHPRLVIFSPGRTWSEATDEVRRRANTAVWIGANLTPSERVAARRWVAASRLSSGDRGKRYADLPSVLAELESDSVVAFRRVYVDGGTLVRSERSEGVADLVHEARDENLVVRLLPTPVGEPVSQRPADALADEGLWVARLLAKGGEDPSELAVRLDADGWLAPLEAWYSSRVGRDDSGMLRILGERGARVPAIVAALDARQLFDVAIYYVRRALASGSARGLGESIEKIFDAPERLVEAREQLDWLEGFAAWLPGLERARRYVAEAERVEDADVEALRVSLVEWAERLEEFVEERRREAFAISFVGYREEYARAYAAVHEAGVGAATVDRLSSEIVGSQSWQALEALSSLTIGEPSYLVDAINLISALREAQCVADVAASLREGPVCACGFRFADRERVAALAASATALVEEGIAHHRRLLEARRGDLRDRLIAFKSSYDIKTIRAIAELAKGGPLPDVDERTIAALNELLSGDDAWARNADTAQSFVFRTKGM